MPTRAELTAAQLSDLFEAFNRHDIDAVMAYFSDDCVFNAAGGEEACGTRFEGVEAVGRAFSNVWTTMPDAHWAHHGHFVHGDRAVSEWIFSGTGKDGGRIEAEGADLFRLRAGKIVFKQAFRKQRPLLKV